MQETYLSVDESIQHDNVDDIRGASQWQIREEASGVHGIRNHINVVGVSVSSEAEGLLACVGDSNEAVHVGEGALNDLVHQKRLQENTLLREMQAVSAKPMREWSVYTVLMFMATQ